MRAPCCHAAPCPGGTRRQVLLRAGRCHPGGRAVRPAALKDGSRPLLAIWHGGQGNRGAEEARARTQSLRGTHRERRRGMAGLSPRASSFPCAHLASGSARPHRAADLQQPHFTANPPPRSPLWGVGQQIPPTQLPAQRCSLPAQSRSVPSRQCGAARALNTGLSVQRARQDRGHAGRACREAT